MAISAAATESGTRTGQDQDECSGGVRAGVRRLRPGLRPDRPAVPGRAGARRHRADPGRRRPRDEPPAARGGKGVAIGGLVTGLLALIVSGALIGGAATVLNNRSAVDRLDKQVQKLKDKLPNAVPSQLTGK